MQFVRSDNVPAYTDYTRYRPYLRQDFLERCAYCERPEVAVGGEAHCEIDHHRPADSFPSLKCSYTNLYYCCRDCNNKKSNKWPRREDEAKGRRFSDPCAEDLYVAHTEESATGLLRWRTECGRFTIDAIRLNRDVLIGWRADREKMRDRIAKFRHLQIEFQGIIVSQNDTAQRTILEQMHLIGNFVADAQRLYGL